MKNTILILLIIFSTSFIYSQSFSDLKEYNKTCHVLYDPSISQLIDKKNYIEDFEVFTILKTKINRKSDIYYKITFDRGPSEDPSFNIYLEQKNEEDIHIGFISAEKLVIPGNGFIYSSGETNQLYNKKQKFQLGNKKITEVKQGAYYIGLKTQTNKPIVLYADKKKTAKTASLPKNYEIEVVIEQDNWFLIKTSYGLTGWVFGNDINTYDMSGVNLTIKKFFYMGD